MTTKRAMPFTAVPIVSADPNEHRHSQTRTQRPDPDSHCAGSPFYEANSPVMVWSAGPDKMIDPNALATVGANKDNVLSWKQQ